jgi:hypothetical protein
MTKYVKGDVYWANRLYTQAIAAPEVDAQDEDKVLQYVAELAGEVYLNPDRMVQLCEDQFIPVSTDDFKQASSLVGEQTLVTEQ